MDDHAGGFIDDDDGFVLVKNGERDGLGKWPLGRWRQLEDDYLAAGAHAGGSFAGSAIEVDEASINGAPEGGAAIGLEPLGEEHIQALTGVVGRDFETLRPGWKFSGQRSDVKEATCSRSPVDWRVEFRSQQAARNSYRSRRWLAADWCRSDRVRPSLGN